MNGNIWMFSDQIDDVDLEFAKKAFIGLYHAINVEMFVHIIWALRISLSRMRYQS